MVDSSKAKKHTVTFKDGVTGGIIKTQTVEHGGNATAPTVPTHTGYTFSKWTGSSYTNVDGNKTVTASYTKKAPTYTVIFFDAINNKILKTEIVEKGKNATPPKVADTANYHFQGWDGSYTNVTSSRKVTVQWLTRIDINSLVKRSNYGSYTYTGKAIKPFTLSPNPLYEGTDYTVLYKNNVNAGTATMMVTGKGRMKGTKIMTFTIKPRICKWNKTWLATQQYTGKALTPSSGTYWWSGAAKNGKSLRFTYTNNVNVGKGRLVVTTTNNNYVLQRGNKTSKTLTLYFNIVKRNIAGTKVWPAQRYTGKAIKPKPSSNWTVCGHRMVEGKDYKLSYANNIRRGTGICYITGIGNYTGIRACKFTIK